MSNIAIIVDVWKYRTDVPYLTGNLLVDPIIEFLNSGIIDVAILASYRCNRELFSKKKWFNERLLSRSIQDLKLNPNSKQQTHDYLLNYENADMRQLSMRYIDEFEEVVKSDDIIYMLGGAFEICLKYRELGYENIKKYFPNISVRTNKSCVRTNQWKIPNIDFYPEWIKISKNTYEYIPG
jgi:hypothetical protein